MLIEFGPIILQTVIIVIAIVAGVRHSEHRISRCETKIEHIEQQIQPIPGISRAVAKIEGRLRK